MPHKVTDFIPGFIIALTEQLKEDEKRWGYEWLNRTRLGQEDRVWETFVRYHREYKENGKPFPWLKVVGNALIAWIRENNPDLFPE